VLCCAVLCCAVLCCAVLCCAVLCCAGLVWSGLVCSKCCGFYPDTGIVEPVKVNSCTAVLHLTVLVIN